MNSPVKFLSTTDLIVDPNGRAQFVNPNLSGPFPPLWKRERVTLCQLGNLLVSVYYDPYLSLSNAEIEAAAVEKIRRREGRI